MNLRRLSLVGLGLLALGLAAPPTASASIVLTFDQPLYTINAVRRRFRGVLHG